MEDGPFVLRTVYLSTVMDATLRTRAFAEGKSKNEVIRELLTRVLEMPLPEEGVTEINAPLVLRTVSLPMSMDQALRERAGLEKKSKNKVIRELLTWALQ